MKRLLGSLTACLVLVLAFSYAWTHRLQMANAVAVKPSPQAEPASDDVQRQAGQMVTVAGPMAEYAMGQKPSNIETIQPQTMRPIAYKPSALDHVGDSPVGTSNTILHKTFKVAGAVDVPFEIPAHASCPRLRGTYRSYLQGAQSGDDSADVEFLLLNAQQFDDFLKGRPSEALFAAESAHDGEVNFTMPVTLDKPVKYYLVFRNDSPREKRKVMQADFRVDF